MTYFPGDQLLHNRLKNLELPLYGSDIIRHLVDFIEVSLEPGVYQIVDTVVKLLVPMGRVLRVAK